MADAQDRPATATEVLPAYRVRVERVDWLSLLPWVRLFGTFRMAIQPAKMLLSLLAVVLLYVGGLALDAVWGPQVLSGEFMAYLARDADQFDAWRQVQRQAAADASLQPVLQGIFETVLDVEIAAFNQMIVAATRLDFGLQALTGGVDSHQGVLGALWVMIIGVPGWLLATHPGFLAGYLLYAFLLTVLLGGAVSRLAALHAALGEPGSANDAMAFTLSRFVWLILAPVIPAATVGVVALLLALAGLVLFNAPGLDVVGGAIFGLLLVGGLVMAVLLVGLAAAGNLLMPAIAVEGTDAFDAISRSFNYVLGRPWRYVFYAAAALVYGAVTYLFLGLVIYLTLWLTQVTLDWWTFAEVGQTGMERFDAVFPSPRLGELLAPAAWSQLDGSGKIAASFVSVWVKLLIGLLPAYAFSFYFCAHTWIYLLLRESVDGTELNHVYVGDRR